MSTPTHLEIRLGALAPPISEQIEEQGLTIGDTQLLERVRSSITFLSVHGYLSDLEKGRAQRKLVNAITEAVDEAHVAHPS